MFLSSCICMCKSVAMCLYTNMGTWEYSFHISDYIRAVCVLIFVSLVLKSLSFSLPIQFLSFFLSLHHFTVLKATCLTVEIILIRTYNYFVVSFSISLFWCTYTANNIHTRKHTLTYHTGTCTDSQANALDSYLHQWMDREGGERDCVEWDLCVVINWIKQMNVLQREKNNSILPFSHPKFRFICRLLSQMDTSYSRVSYSERGKQNTLY